jgi:hypothetical protein
MFESKYIHNSQSFYNRGPVTEIVLPFRFSFWIEMRRRLLPRFMTSFWRPLECTKLD